MKDPDESDEQFQQSVNARFRALRFAGAESDLQTIPGVGKNIAQDLIDLGYPTVESLRGQDPEELYRKDCLRKGRIEDRCQLYVFREAVYFAGQEEHDPEKLKWWNWKD
ncbi:MAG: Pathogenicity locus [Clostridium sp.]|nr:Pathogenicity locus [Clostridium sp.]HJB49621.1 helix-hairpin-helix domain-containing protein [Candidatus Anaeromassilibacillus stercoravium]